MPVRVYFVALVDLLKTLNAKVAGTFLPGNSEATILEAANRAGLASLHPQVVELYATFDGQADQYYTGVVPSVYYSYEFSRLDAALETRNYFAGDEEYRPTWLPVMSHGDGWMVVENDPGSDDYGRVINYTLYGTPPVVAFRDVGAMLTTLLRSFREGAIPIVDGEVESPDESALCAIGIAENPGIEGWVARMEQALNGEP